MANSRFQKLLEMLEEQPQDEFLLYALAMEYLGMDQPAEAEKLFRAIIGANEQHIPSYYQLGKLRESANEQEAITLFEKGMELAKEKQDLKTMNEFRTAIDELLF
jgi:tetratricopeptide (TPR) repeat protein